MNSINYEADVERLIHISKTKPLLPDTFVPWTDEPDDDTLFMPAGLVSLEGHELWDTLSKAQQIELGRLEMVQVMYSYAWSETLACLFFNRHLLDLSPGTSEYRFMIRMLIEEFRHQEMFGMAIDKLERTPVTPTFVHKFFGRITAKYFPSSLVFMSVLAIELLTDAYSKHIRRDEAVYSILRKTSELHHIEEARHILYTESWLKKYTKNAGFFKASLYSFIVLLNIYFMRSLYIQKGFFEQIGVSNPNQYYRAAIKSFNLKFSKFALNSTIEFVNTFNGLNWLTKPLWNWVLKVKL